MYKCPPLLNFPVIDFIGPGADRGREGAEAVVWRVVEAFGMTHADLCVHNLDLKCLKIENNLNCS